jgi:hypothetical protein
MRVILSGAQRGSKDPRTLPLTDATGFDSLTSRFAQPFGLSVHVAVSLGRSVLDFAHDESDLITLPSV